MKTSWPLIVLDACPTTPPARSHAAVSYESRHRRNHASSTVASRSRTTLTITSSVSSDPPGTAPRPVARLATFGSRDGSAASVAVVSGSKVTVTPPAPDGMSARSVGSTAAPAPRDPDPPGPDGEDADGVDTGSAVDATRDGVSFADPGVGVLAG